MAFDGMVTTAVTAELSRTLTGGKIDKVYQPAPEELILHIHNGREKYRLYISANTSHASLYLTEDKGGNPMNPPAFCMLLRKHLQQARIREIRQVDSERIVEIYTDAVNELGFDVKHKLIIEIMGKHSNILLVDIATNKILDCIKRISGDVNRYRQTLPGLQYVAPPSHNKVSYFGLSYQGFLDALPDLATDPEKALVRGIQGISPAMAAELNYRAQSAIAGSDREYAPALYTALAQAVTALSTGGANPGGADRPDLTPAGTATYGGADRPDLTPAGTATASADGDYRPAVYCSESGAPVEFHALRLTMYEENTSVLPKTSISEACSAYYEGRTSTNRIRQKSADIYKAVSTGLDKLLLKKQKLSEDLVKAENSEDYRLYGELLTASLHDVKEGRNSAEVLNYYDGTMLSIPLDPRFTPAQNAQRYFKKYAKSRTAITEKAHQLEETEVEINYLDSVLAFIEDSRTVDDLEDIRAELVENGYLKKRNVKERARKLKFSPLEYRTTSGKRVLAGRNNRENDLLTFKNAGSKDIWMHTKDIPGSHVVLFTEGAEPTEEEIFETAAIAALHSKAKLSSQVPVDYVLIKHVKKPAGSKPGYVIFTHNRTVYVTPAQPDSEKN